MKTKTILFIILLSFMEIHGFTQEKSRQELKEERKIEKQKLTEALVNAREFVFTAETAFPMGGGSVNLTTNLYYMKFHPDRIESELPFYGRAYSGAGYGGDTGLKFEGTPVEYTVIKTKKEYQIDAIVKGEQDTYRISLSVGFEGSASLSVISDNRSSISFSGEISAPEKPTE
jgi:hypothetical protein